MTKEQNSVMIRLQERAIRRVERFFELNKLELPVFDTTPIPSRILACGYYRPNQINIDHARCSLPAREDIPTQWSWPGSKIDKTPYGVVCHEAGHAVDHLLKMPSHGFGKRSLVREKISGYEPNKSESFAETMRLFITNPSLLKDACPNRYEFLTVDLALLPLSSGDIISVVGGRAPPQRIVTAIQRWKTRHD